MYLYASSQVKNKSNSMSMSEYRIVKAELKAKLGQAGRGNIKRLGFLFFF